MSKVSIQGNSLGTGTLTIAAPNTNTDRTLTLPDETGTVVTTASSPTFAGTASATKFIPTGGTATGNGMYLPAANTLAWSTNGAEGMRIDSSGNLLVNTTAAVSGFFNGKITIDGKADNCITAAVNATGDSVNSVTLGSWHVSDGAGARYHCIFYDGTTRTYRGQITTNGTGTSYTSASDYRLKENIQPMQNALDKVKQLNPVTFTWKESGRDGQGFIAHELQSVVPDCVTGEKDAVDSEGNPKYQGVDTSFLVATLTAAIQELNAKVEAQAAEIAALKRAA